MSASKDLAFLGDDLEKFTHAELVAELTRYFEAKIAAQAERITYLAEALEKTRKAWAGARSSCEIMEAENERLRAELKLCAKVNVALMERSAATRITGGDSG